MAIFTILIVKNTRTWEIFVSSSIFNFFQFFFPFFFVGVLGIELILNFFLQFYSFHWRSLASLVRFMRRYFIYFLRLLWIGLFLFQWIYYWCIKKLAFFVSWFCILLQCWQYLSDLIFLRHSFSGLLNKII
jgi:hypothetical protein